VVHRLHCWHVWSWPCAAWLDRRRAGGGGEEAGADDALGSAHGNVFICFVCLHSPSAGLRYLSSPADSLLMVNAGYIAEAAVSGVLLLPLWVVYLGQIAAHRCTPSNALRGVERRALLIGSLCLVLNTVRCVDMNGVFGFLNISAVKGLLDVVCVLEVAFICVVLVAGSSSLQRQMQRRPKRRQTVALAALVSVQAITSVVLPCIETALLAQPASQSSDDALRWCQFVRNYVFVAVVTTFVFLLLAIYAGLRRSIRSFVARLQLSEQGAKQLEHHEQPSRSQPLQVQVMGGASPTSQHASITPTSPAEEADGAAAATAQVADYPACTGVTTVSASSIRTAPLSVRVATARREALETAMHRFTRLTAWITVICLAALGITLSGDQQPSSHEPIDTEEYRYGRALVMLTQVVALSAIWLETRVSLQPLHEAARQKRLWQTLRSGCRSVQPSNRTTPGPQQIDVDEPDVPHPIPPPQPLNPAGVADMSAGASPVFLHPGMHLSVPAAPQPLDSAASVPHSGLSMRSGLTSFRAVRREGDAGPDLFSQQATPFGFERDQTAMPTSMMQPHGEHVDDGCSRMGEINEE